MRHSLSNLEPGRDMGCILYIKKALNQIVYHATTDHKDRVWTEVKLLNKDKLLIRCPNSSHEDNKKINTTLR